MTGVRRTTSVFDSEATYAAKPSLLNRNIHDFVGRNSLADVPDFLGPLAFRACKTLRSHLDAAAASVALASVTRPRLAGPINDGGNYASVYDN